MKRKQNKIIYILMIILLALTSFYIYFLATTKIWTYVSYPFIKESTFKYQIILKKRELNNITSCSYFLYKTKKYKYEVIETKKIEENIIVLIKIKKKFKDFSKDEVIMIPKTKKTLLNLIIDSWRSWKMKKLTNEELKKIEGGLSSAVLGLGISALIAFLAGFIDGFVNPEPCGGE